MLEKAPEAAPHAKASQAARISAEYAAIERLLLSSVRGRWFLSEHARRHRAADTEMLLDAITRLELVLLRPQRRHPDHALGDLVEMRQAILRMRQDIDAQRMERMVTVLRFIEQRLDAMIEIWSLEDIGSLRMDARQEPTAAEALVSEPHEDSIGASEAPSDPPEGEARGIDSQGLTLSAAPSPVVMVCGAKAPPLEPLTLAQLSAVKREALFG